MFTSYDLLKFFADLFSCLQIECWPSPVLDFVLLAKSPLQDIAGYAMCAEVIHRIGEKDCYRLDTFTDAAMSCVLIHISTFNKNYLKTDSKKSQNILFSSWVH